MRNLVLFDVSPFLYSGSAYATEFDENMYSYRTRPDAGKVNGLNTGGIRMLMSRVAVKVHEGAIPVLVFDSKSNKKSLYDDYKSDRVFKPEIGVQNQILKDLVPRTGINCVIKSGYEADDLISALVYKYAGLCDSITIYTGDRDIASCLIGDKVRILGVCSRDPSIAVTNYSEIVNSKYIVPYNCILPFFTFYGKPSNTIKPLFDENTNATLLLDYMTFCDRNKVVQGLQSHLMVMEAWLKYKEKSGLEAEKIRRIREQTLRVYPLSIAQEDPVLLVEDRQLNMAIVKDFCSMFKLYSSAQCFGVEATDNVGRAQREYIEECVKSLSSGTYYADNCENLATSVFTPEMDIIGDEDVGGF